MKTADVIAYFGSPANATAHLQINGKPISRQAIGQWGATVPWQWQAGLEYFTGGQLLMEPRLLMPGFNDPHKKRRAKMYGGGK